MTIVGLIVVILLIAFLLGGPRAGWPVAAPMSSVLWVLVVILVVMLLLNFLGVFGHARSPVL
jgi:hypothetical protein